jgi:hypothetical protein
MKLVPSHLAVNYIVKTYLTIRRAATTIEYFHIVSFAQDPVLVDPKLLSGAQLSLASITGEASKMVDLVKERVLNWKSFCIKNSCHSNSYCPCLVYLGRYDQSWTNFS